MRRLESHLDTRSAEYRRYREHNLRLVREFRDLQQRARYQRPERDRERLARQNKLFVRDRLELLLDRGAPFLELSGLAANQAYDGEVAGAGVVCGIGTVAGREVLVQASDSSIKGGAWYPLSIRKIVRALEVAMDNRLPVVHLVDSAGAFLPMQSEIFTQAGRLFRHQCVLSKMGVEQVAVTLGHCTAGGAYVPTLSDYSIMVRGTGGVFLGGPPLVKAATGEEVPADELGGADLHASISGTADYAVDTEAEGIALAREVVGNFRRRDKVTVDTREPREPHYDPEELYGVIPDDGKVQFDMREVLARILDGSLFHEYRPDYGTTLVCGYGYIWGCKVGVLANNGVLFSDSAKKAATFMQLCDRDGVPLVFLHNITGFMIGKEYEREGITKDGAKMIMVQAAVEVPKFSVIVGGTYGAGYYAMAGRPWDPRFVFSWPNSKISVMGAEQAANTLVQVQVNAMARKGKAPTAQEIEAIRAPVLESYQAQSSAYYATSELWDDGILDPVDTRNALGMAISASRNGDWGPGGRYGVLRL